MHIDAVKKLLLGLFALLVIPVCGAQGIAGNAGIGGRAGLGGGALVINTFTETWNRGSGDPCSGNIATTACVQTWWSRSGSGESLVAATGCAASGWNYTNVLKLPFATSPEVDAMGTLPYIPQSSGATYDLSFEYCYDSTNVSGFTTFFELDYYGASTHAYYLMQAGNGSGQIYVNNGGTSVSLSVSTRHLIHVHVAGASSYTQIDGGTQYTFTAVSADFMLIRLMGDSIGSNLYFGNISMSASSYPGGTWPPSAFADMAGGTNGATVTAAALNTGTHCGNGGTSYGGWTYAAGGSTDTVTFDTSNTQNLNGNVTACGTAYPGTSGVSVRHHVPAAATPGATIFYLLPSAYAVKTVGFHWKVNSSNPSSNGQTDQARFDASGGIGTAFAVCASTTTTTCTGSGSNLNICVEDSSGTFSPGCHPITNNTWYWITMTCNASGNDTFTIYNAAGTSQVATFTVTNTNHCAIGTGNDFRWGGVGTETPGVDTDAYSTNFIIEMADAVFPVLPP